MKKQITYVTLAAAIGFGSVLVPPVKANTLQDLKEEKSQIQEEKSEVETKIDEAEQKLSENQAQQSSIQAQIKEIDMKVTDTENKIAEKNVEIENTKAEIETLKAEIVVLEERIAKRNELLKDRARNFQENGSMVSYIDVLMGAKSFSDFIDRMSAVATIVEADQDILREHQADKEELEAKKKEVEDKLAGLEKMLADLEGMKQSLESQKAEKDKLMATLQREETELHEHKMALAEEQSILANQAAAMQKAIQMEQERQAKAAAEAAAAAAAAAANNSSGGGSTESGGGSTVSAPAVSGGSFTRPSAGYLSSGFGVRWGKLHAGVDLAAKGTVPVVSAADGVVIRSYYSSSYGNAIFIAHSINGQTYTTVYAHLSSRSVGEGQVVSKGQFIGNMGNTGDSYGQHLHFELHRGGWNASKSNAINPVGIVPL
ncbi:peptidoglycan DD-metalloendopeptidase family protein [Robertmurraya korlensis]|uniref:murein hydrolase activator EnvC family protein n=1 Tax=Robertmurraya korlensis TaxID=519977 RepID=UPI002040A2CE|nr:peptidoglycan DD-metalloendopeptidase family protein [Robertmurraya korlensis]